MTIHLTLTPSKLASLDLTPTDNSIEEVTELCSEYEVDEAKDGLALIPARFKPCPEDDCRGSSAVDCGGALHRLGVNVTEMTCLGADLDDISEEAFADTLRALRAKGLMFWAWETFSHQPNTGTVRARILIPFTEPLPIKHPSQWRDVAWPALIKYAGLDGAATADRACKDPARVYYTPRKPTEESVREAGFSPGVALDWRVVLGDALEHAAVATEVPAPLDEDTARSVDLEPIRENLRRIKAGAGQPWGLSTLLKNVLAGNAPVPPPDQREEGQPSRYVAWRTITAAIANAAEGWESREALLELLKPAFAAEVQEDPNDHTDWDVIGGLLETAMANAPAHKAQRAAEREAKAKAQRDILRRALRRAAPPPPPDTPTRPTEPSAEDSTEGDEADRRYTERVDALHRVDADNAAFVEGDEADWTEGLLFTTTKKGDQELKNCTANVAHFLRYSPEWRNVFRLNLVTQKIEMHGGPLQDHDDLTPFKDEIVARVADWFQHQPDELAMHPADGVVLSRIRSVAELNAYDPLKDYLNGLAHDGTSRVDTALEAYFNALRVDATGADITEYVRMVSRRWAISAVARGLQPGCKVDTVMILEGLSQGEKKTTAFEILGGQFYTAQQIDLHNKDSWMIIAQRWIVELGELETFRKSEETAKKAFLSLRVDTFRKPYGYDTQDYLRRCVFVGSTNKSDYLKDETGNRRYWPVRCGDANLPALRRDRDQLWAEAVALFKAGGKDKCEACKADTEDRCNQHRWWFTREEEAMWLHAQNVQRMAPDAFAEKIVDMIRRTPVESRPREYTMLEILELIECDITKGYEMRVGAALRRLGFMKARKRSGYDRPMVWVVPERVLRLPFTKLLTGAAIRQAPLPRAEA